MKRETKIAIILAALTIALWCLVNWMLAQAKKDATAKAPVYQVVPQKKIETKTVVYYKHIKSLKSTTEQKTDYEYQLDPVGRDKFKLMPVVYTETTYYVVYTDGTHEKVTEADWIGLSVGDSLKFVKQVPINS